MPLESGHLADLLVALIAGTTIVFIAYSPLPRLLGQAIAHRIMHGSTPKPRDPGEVGRVDDLSGEVAALRRALEETQERLDFTERVLAQKERGVVGPGTGR